MARIEIPMQVPGYLIEAAYKQMTDNRTVAESMDYFALKSVPDESSIDSHISSLKQQFFTIGVFNHLYFNSEGNLTHQVKPGVENQEQQNHQLYSQMLEFMTVAMHLIILKSKESGLFTTDNIMSYIAESKVMNGRRLSIIEKGIYYFLNDDYVASISILVPQIEWLTRRLFSERGYTVTDFDRIGTKSDALGTLLNNEDIVLLDRNITKYLKAILSERTGWNLRNLYSHGLSDEFSISHADRIFHVILLLSTLTR